MDSLSDCVRDDHLRSFVMSSGVSASQSQDGIWTITITECGRHFHYMGSRLFPLLRDAAYDSRAA